MSNQLPKRKLSELLIKYRLAPSLKDVYVEGVRDAKWYDWYLRKKGIGKVVFFPIDAVEVSPDKFLPTTGSGNRARVIAAACELEKQGCPDSPLFIYDSDFDLVRGRPVFGGLLARTDVTAPETYAFCPEALDNILSMATAVFTGPRASDIYATFSVTLGELFAMRAAIDELDLRLSAPPFALAVTGPAHTPRFNAEKYAMAYLQGMKGGIGLHITTLMALYSANLLTFLGNIQHRIHGDDYLMLLASLLRSLGTPPALQNPQGLRSALLLSIDLPDLDASGLFTRLRSWAER